ncbi:MAG: hypothetical protein ACI4XE_07915, partial [Acutalibacteraceae bacterium]
AEYTDEEEMKEHSFTLSVTNPTCTEKGYTTHTCSLCGTFFTDSFKEPLNHPYATWKTVKEPTENENGLKVKTCDLCSAELERIEIPKTEPQPEEPQPEKMNFFMRILMAILNFLKKLFSGITV